MPERVIFTRDGETRSGRVLSSYLTITGNRRVTVLTDDEHVFTVLLTGDGS